MMIPLRRDRNYEANRDTLHKGDCWERGDSTLTAQEYTQYLWESSL